MATNLVYENSYINFGRNMGIIASGDYSVSPSTFENAIRDNTSGTPVESTALIQDIFFDNVRMYLLDTNQNLMLNDVYNTNMFLKESMSKEMERTSSLRNKTFNDIHKTRERYMRSQYDIQYYNFIAAVMQGTMFIILCIALLLAFYKQKKISIKIGSIIVGILVLIYVIIVLMYIKQNQSRRKDDWNKFYFTTKETMISSCK
jgi:lipopolysaccharide export LptBFGC system permease protein LptF